MKTIIILLLAFGMKAQTWDKIKQRDDVFHFYGAMAIGETTHRISEWACPKLTFGQNMAVSNGVTIGLIFGKEIYDKHKAKPTGFSWDDVAVGLMGLATRDILKVCLRDYKSRKKGEFIDYNNY